MQKYRTTRNIFQKLQSRRPTPTITTLREDKSGKWVFESESPSVNNETLGEKNLLRSGFLSTVWPGAIMAGAIVASIPSQVVMLVGIAMGVSLNLAAIIKRQGTNNEFTSGVAAAFAIANAFGTSIWPTAILAGFATLTGRESSVGETRKEWVKTTVGVFAGTLAGATLAYTAATLNKPVAPYKPDAQQPRSTVQIKSSFTDTAKGLNFVIAENNEDYKVKTAMAPIIQPQ